MPGGLSAVPEMIPPHQVAPGAEPDGLALAAEVIDLPGTRRGSPPRSVPFTFMATIQNPFANRD